MEKKIIKITDENDIISALNRVGISYCYACKLLRNKDVRLNGEKMKENTTVFPEDELVVFSSESIQSPEEILKKSIKFEDDNIVVISKPVGIEIEGKNGLADKLKALPVHRLDRNTTGLVILAKNKTAQNILTDAIKNKQISKKYYAEVVGKTDYKNFTHNAYLLKNSKDSLVKIFNKQVKGSLPITTIFNTIKSNPSSSVVECTLVTGKTHQIRASLAFLGHAIIGDGKYGKNEDNKKFKEKYQKLHSFYIGFKSLPTPLDYLSGKNFIDKPTWLK